MKPIIKSDCEPLPLSHVLERSLTNAGKSISELSSASPVLVVFLRHAGCIFCREAIRDISRGRTAIERYGVRIILVHMKDTEAIQKTLAKYDLLDVDRICDPEQELYRAFGLKRGSFFQLFGWKVTWRSLVEIFQCGIGARTADPSQMPGVFLIDESEIVRRFRHRSAADRPDYVKYAVAQ